MAPDTMETFEFRIRGMDCAEEVDTLKRELGPLVGGEHRLTFDLLRGKMAVKGTSVAAADIVRAVNKAGMQAELWIERPRTRRMREGKVWFRDGRAIVTILSGVLTLTGLVVHTILRGGFAEALGSEGLGRTHDVPLPARLVYLTAVIVGIRLPCRNFIADRTLLASSEIIRGMKAYEAGAVCTSAT